MIFLKIENKRPSKNPECGKTLEPIPFFLSWKSQTRKRHQTPCIFFFGTIILWSETPNFVKSLLNRFGRCEGHEARNKSKLHDKVSSRMHQPRPKKWMLDGFWLRSKSECKGHFEVKYLGLPNQMLSHFSNWDPSPAGLVKEFGVPLQRQSRDSVIDCWILVFCEAFAHQLRSLQSVRVTIALFACVVLSSRCFAKFWDGFCEANQAMCGLSGLYQHFETA